MLRNLVVVLAIEFHCLIEASNFIDRPLVDRVSTFDALRYLGLFLLLSFCVSFASVHLILSIMLWPRCFTMLSEVAAAYGLFQLAYLISNLAQVLP